ncbi:oxidoreductase [Cohnella xylanilytica]|uniref:FAD-binding oxidoreductase n=1 Tax=Cohnella xylanilytica TaxID=557555 RepID=A0A841TUA3_9BACL|nr:FAD-binding oxidoreductase [Cohnella xylanilytica]MBB6692097.1 FAD-binding oxidoreductase [Cohnella xylanilytica]GIO11279.1 oxidoreductase [Cohnella xylanilytica]
MSLYYGSLYWPATWPNPPRYPSLSGTDRCKALVIGGGMSGSLCGLLLARSGIDAVLIEQNEVASGSSLANTGLIQYSNDIMLSHLAEQIGERNAVLFYKECKDAVLHLARIAETLPRDVGFKLRSSLYMASSKDDVAALRREYEMLDRFGFGAEWWDGRRIEENFPFRREAAIVTRGDAEMNPYRFVHAVVEEAAKQGLRVYEKTPMLSVQGERGRFVVRAGRGEIRADNLVYAVGYTPEAAGSALFAARLNRSYAMATKPLEGLSEWHQRFLLWETSRPYLYARTTEDGRIVAGGLDEPLRRPVLSDSELRQRTLRLRSDIGQLFPGLEPEPEYEWCATFGESADNLPWLGEDPRRPGTFYALGYGGNGTVYGAIAARLIRDSLIGEKSPVAPIVRPDRPIPIASAAAARARRLAKSGR